MNYRAMLAVLMAVGLLAAPAAFAEKPTSDALPAPEEAVTAVDTTVDVAAEIDHTAAEPAARDAAVDRVDATETDEMSGNVTEPMGPPTAARDGMGASSSTVETTASPPANLGQEERMGAAVRIQGMGAPAQVAEVDHRAGPAQVVQIPVYKPDTVAEVDQPGYPVDHRVGPVAVAAPTYEHRAPETPAPNIATLEPQDKLTSNAERAMSEVAQRVNADIPHC